MNNELPNRLLAISHYIEPNDYIADIGSDHGYLPIYLALHHSLRGINASDNKRGPYRRLVNNVLEAGLQDKIVCQLANGLELLPIGVDTIIISGMGGEQIREILTKGAPKLSSIKKLILLPHCQVKEVRLALHQWGMAIQEEAIIEEGPHFYSLIVAKPGDEKLRIDQAIFGPRLLEKPTPAMYKMWTQYAQKLQKIADERNLPANRQTEIQQELQLISLFLRIEVSHND